MLHRRCHARPLDRATNPFSPVHPRSTTEVTKRAGARMPAAAAACSLAVGIAAASAGCHAVPAPALTCCAALAALIPAVVNIVHNGRARARVSAAADVALLCALSLSGVALYTARHVLVHPDEASLLADGGNVTVEGRVVEARRGGRRARAVVRMKPARGSLWVSWPEGALGPVRGELVRATGKVSAARPVSNPGAFDFRSYLADRGIHAVMSADRVAVLEGPHGISAAAAWVRGEIGKRLPVEQADVMRALLLGDSSGLPEEVLSSFRRSGTVHVLAVSGLHVGFVALMAGALLRCLGVPRRWARLLVIPCLCFFVALVGARPSAVRAAIMASALIVSWSLERSSPTLNTMGAAALAILLVRPGSLFDLGFALSFGATLGIVLLHPAIRAVLAPLGRLGRPGRLAADSVAISLSAQLGVTPVALLAFGEISLVSPLSNLAAVPLAAFSVASGAAMLATSALPAVSRVFAGSAWASLTCLSWTSGAMGGLWLSSARIAARFWPVAALLAAGVGLSRCRGRMRVWCPATLSAACLVAALTWSLGPGQDRPRMIAFDVGQGDAVLLELPGRRHVLVDAGPSWGGASGGNAGSSIVAPYLRKRGVSRLDALVVTHGHVDHYGGATSVLSEFRTETLVLPAGFERSEELSRLADRARELGTDVVEACAGDVLTPAGGSSLWVLSPTAALAAGASENDASVVLRVGLSWATALLTGDVEEAAESAMVEAGRVVPAEILKVAHHGSATSSSEALLDSASPLFALVSVGEGNRYGHPDDVTLARLEAAGASVFRTDVDGALVVDVLHDRVRVRGFRSGIERGAVRLVGGPERAGPDDDGRESGGVKEGH